MEILQSFYKDIISILPVSLVVIMSILVIVAARYFINRQFAHKPGRPFRRQVITLVLSFVALLLIILAMPIGDNTRGQLLGLIGILLSAAIALSSTTFVGNAFAGMMLRAVRSFRSGDFIRVGDFFGRVSERGLFHIEIQTEDRDLITMPNLFLVTNPVKVTLSSGTIVSTEVSLSYDISRIEIEKLLLDAAKNAELEEPFVHIVNLNDFSVTYRIAGLLKEVKQLISIRSRLREMVLDSLHVGGIEIVSPTFMNTRALSERKIFIPDKIAASGEVESDREKAVPENIVFDKAEQAESLERMKHRIETLGKEIESIKERQKQADEETIRDELKLHKEWLERRREKLAEIIKKKENEEEKE
ncbi:MAG: mechanosensitive ion channel family protein [Candidatus Zixiibacteriota bacterium]|nr:MAG: mechanosensitive ion channel family protein [candidate division Zixibacteria bacterium]